METINIIFGSRLKMLREQAGLRQEDVGEWFKMQKSTVSQWENGRLPHASIIAELASNFNVTTDFLLGLTNECKLGTTYPINDPDIQKLMETVVVEFHQSPEVPEKAKQEILREMTTYFKYKLEQEKHLKR